MRRVPQATWIAVVVVGIFSAFASLLGNVGATAFTWLSPGAALILFLFISLALLGFSLWQERQKFDAQAEATATSENRCIMLDRVHAKWIAGFLENPLYYDEELLPLPLRQRIGSRYDLVLSSPLDPSHPLPPGTTITQVFDQAGGALLLLGEPGAGKTTLLLELARDLLERARNEEDILLPVVLNLSSWATRKLSLEQWVVEELRTKYHIPSYIGKAWVAAHQLLLLLDGLDEVAPVAQSACIEAVNQYCRQARRSLVVCSRTKDYLDQPRRLALSTAVVIQTLTSQQVDGYLSVLGTEVDGLKQTLKQSESLRTLATTPLLLKVLILTYHGKSAQELLSLVQATPAKQQHLLFDGYVKRMLQQEGKRLHTTVQQIRHWLVWLASQLTEHNQTELYLEELQADWLPDRDSVRLYRRGLTVAAGLVTAALAVLIFGLVLALFAVPILAGLVSGLIGWLVVGLIVWGSFMEEHRTHYKLDFRRRFGLRIEKRSVNLGEIPVWSWANIGLVLPTLLVCVLVGLVFGLGVGLVLRSLDGFVGLPLGLSFGLFFGLSLGLLDGLDDVLSYKKLERRDRNLPNQGIWHSGRNGLFVGLAVCLIFGLPAWLLFRLVFRQSAWVLFVGLLVGAFDGLITGLENGDDVWIRHMVLRLVLWRSGYMPAPWQYIAFLDDTVDQLLLRKVGGGYVFRHRLLQDYFASLDSAPLL